MIGHWPFSRPPHHGLPGFSAAVVAQAAPDVRQAAGAAGAVLARRIAAFAGPVVVAVVVVAAAGAVHVSRAAAPHVPDGLLLDVRLVRELLVEREHRLRGGHVRVAGPAAA